MGLAEHRKHILVPDIICYGSYEGNFISDVCRCLWKQSKDGKNPKNDCHSHAERFTDRQIKETLRKFLSGPQIPLIVESNQDVVNSQFFY